MTAKDRALEVEIEQWLAEATPHEKAIARSWYNAGWARGVELAVEETPEIVEAMAAAIDRAHWEDEIDAPAGYARAALAALRERVQS
jgi:hypothetical protein